MPPRLYLRLGDRVFHTDHEEWGEGAVVEEMTSVLEGGTCLVRVMFADGRQRTFHNDLESDLCCYFFGVRKQWRGAAGALLEPDAEPGERPLRVRVDPGDAERARLRHALLVGLFVGGKAALLEVEEHPLGHASRVVEARRCRNGSRRAMAR